MMTMTTTTNARDQLEDAGYMPSLADTWISPYTGDLMSFARARAEMQNPPQEDEE